MIEAVIFDMDGLLVDSEPLWQQAEIEVFGEAGVPLTNELCLETTGLRIDQVVEHWDRRFGLVRRSPDEVRRRVLDRVCALISERAEEKPGATEAIERAAARHRTALASSSPHPIIDAVLDRFGIRDRFEVIHSADEEPYGKPHPAVYLTTAARLSVSPLACLALEDSLNGVLAAKAARMRCLAVPEGPAGADPRFAIADERLPSLLDLDEPTWQRLTT